MLKNCSSVEAPCAFCISIEISVFLLLYPFKPWLRLVTLNNNVDKIIIKFSQS